jgi:O-antigen/teichoic acid export membrane protein
LILAGLVALALALRIALLAASTHLYDDAGLVTAHGNVAVNILAGRGIVENVTAEQAIDAREQAEQRLIDPADVALGALPAPHYQPEVLQPPGEAVLLAGIWKLTGDERYLYLQVLQVLIDSLMVLLVYRIAMVLFRRPRAALLAAAGYALFVPVAVLVRIPHLDAWAVFFTIAIVAAWAESLNHIPRWPWLIIVGVLTGSGTYFRPGVLLLPPLLALASWRRGQSRSTVVAAAIPIGVALVLMVPWTVRNAITFHQFIPTRIGIGQNLWEGLGEVHNNFGAILDDQVTLQQVHRVHPGLVYGTPAYDAYLEHKAISAIENHPLVMLHAIARRILVTTVDLNTLGGSLGILEPLLFIFAVFVAVITRRRYRDQHALLAAVPIATILPYLLLHVEGRYVLPASFVYLIWAGLGVDLAYERLTVPVSPELSLAPAGAPGPTSRPLTSDVVLTLGGKVCVIVFQVAGMVLIARQLGPAGRGSVGVALALLLLLQQLGSVGLASANPFYGVQDRRNIEHIVSNSILVAVLVGGVLGALTLLARLLVPSTLRGLSWLDVSLVAVAVPGALMFLFLQSVLLGEGRMVGYNVVEASQSLIATALLAFGLYVLGMQVTGSIAVLACIYWLGAVAYLAMIRARSARIGRVDLGLARRMFGYAFRIYLAAFLAYLIIRLDLFLVNSYLGARQAGLYGVAGSLADGLFMLPMVVGLNVFPRVAGGAERSLSATVFRLVTLVYGTVVLVSVVLAGPIIRLLYGAQFEPSVGLYRWLAPGVFSLGLVTVLSYHFAGRGFPRQALTAWFAGLALNLGINLAFLASNGTYVAALSSSIAYTLLLVLYVRLFAREVGGLRELVPRPHEVGVLLGTLIRRKLPATP